MNVWVEAIRPRTLPAAISPVLVGTAASDNFIVWRFAAALVVALAIQVGVNLANDLFDAQRGVDTELRVGPRRVTAAGLVSPKQMRVAMVIAFGVAAIAGLALAICVNLWLLAVGAASFVAALAYSGGSRPYAALGLGEVFVFVFFGLVATVGSSFVQDEQIHQIAYVAAIPVGLLATAILVVNNLRDTETDRAAGKRTLAVRLGERKTRLLYQALVVVAFLDTGAVVAVTRTRAPPSRPDRGPPGRRTSKCGPSLARALRIDRSTSRHGTVTARLLGPLSGGVVGMELIPFRIPLKVRFRGVAERYGMLVGGSQGWGEFSPFLDYAPPATATWAAAALEAADKGWPRPMRRRIPVNTTIPAVSAEVAHEMTKASGCTTVKVKVAEGDDEARVEAVRDALGPNGKVRIDVNGAWSVSEAIENIKNLDRYTLEYVEQPVATLEEMAEVRLRVDVPLAADESVRNAEDPLRIRGLEAADIVVLKVQPLGGVRRCLEIAEACGLPVVVSSAVETSIGLAAGAALAAALPDLPYACGLGTLSLLEGDVADRPCVPLNGEIPVRRPEVDPDAVEPYRLDGDEAHEMHMRFRTAVSYTERA